MKKLIPILMVLMLVGYANASCVRDGGRVFADSDAEGLCCSNTAYDLVDESGAEWKICGCIPDGAELLNFGENSVIDNCCSGIGYIAVHGNPPTLVCGTHTDQCTENGLPLQRGSVCCGTNSIACYSHSGEYNGIWCGSTCPDASKTGDNKLMGLIMFLAVIILLYYFISKYYKGGKKKLSQQDSDKIFVTMVMVLIGFMLLQNWITEANNVNVYNSLPEPFKTVVEAGDNIKEHYVGIAGTLGEYIKAGEGAIYIISSVMVGFVGALLAHLILGPAFGNIITTRIILPAVIGVIITVI